VADVPGSIFITELLDAYPNAKVILTMRASDAWVRSMQSSVLHAWSSPDKARVPNMVAMGDALKALWDGDFDANGVDFYLRHNQRARDEVAKRGRKLLELDVSQPASWERMCEWLDKEAPPGMTEFPLSDAWVDYKKKHGLGGYEKQLEAPRNLTDTGLPNIQAQ
jgi:Sulfotransferase domain